MGLLFLFVVVYSSAHIIDPKSVFARVGIPVEFKAKNLGVEMFRDLARYIYDNKIEIKTKEEIKIIKEQDTVTHVDSDDPKIANRLLNKTQRRASAQKKIEAKKKKNLLNSTNQ